LASWAEPKARPKKIFGGLFWYRVLENISIFESIFGNQNRKGILQDFEIVPLFSSPKLATEYIQIKSRWKKGEIIFIIKTIIINSWKFLE
jgi:hypothetical protein